MITPYRFNYIKWTLATFLLYDIIVAASLSSPITLCPALLTIRAISHNDFAEDRTNTIQFSSVHFSPGPVKLDSLLWPFMSLHSLSLTFGLPEPRHLLTCSTPITSVSPERPQIRRHLTFAYFYAHLTRLCLFLHPSITALISSICAGLLSFPPVVAWPSLSASPKQQQERRSTIFFL